MMSGRRDYLDDAQTSALQAFKDGKSIALIGGAGCGKSFLLNKLIEEAEAMHGKFPFVVACAHSNRAANAIKGSTIHSLFGAKCSWEFSKEYLWEGVKTRQTIRERLEKIKVLIFDEISLLKSNEIEAIDFVLRSLAKSEWHSSLPFGGRIIIAAGDPFQLEPYEERGTLQVEAKQIFYQSRAWYLVFGAQGDGIVVVLKSNHRQAGDRRFFDMLNRIRTGIQSLEDIEELNCTSVNISEPPPTHTRLLTTIKEVQEVNREVLRALPGNFVNFPAYDTYFVTRTPSLESRLGKVAPKQVSLKVGALVILTRKCGEVLPGSQGAVRAIRNLIRHRQFPRVEVDVLVSTAAGFGDEGVDRNNQRIVTVGLERFDVHGYDRSVMATREQIPVIPGYALTVHRSQGMTMSNVAIDFKTADNWRPFGLVYVALSRCTTKSGLWVRNLRDNHIRVSHRATALMFELCSLWDHIPIRVIGVRKRACLGLDDDSDDSTDSGDSDDDEQGGNVVDLVSANESVVSVNTDSSVVSVKCIKYSVIPVPVSRQKKKRCFKWERKEK